MQLSAAVSRQIHKPSLPLSGCTFLQYHAVFQVNADEYSKLDKELLEMIEDVLLNRCENSTERMLEYAATLDPKCKPTDVKKKGAAPGAKATGGKEKSWRDEPVEKRLTHALVKGIDEFAVRVCLLCLPALLTCRLLQVWQCNL